MDRIARYKRLTGPQEIQIVERGKECAVEFVWLLADKAEPVTLIDMCFAWAVAIGGRGTGRRINPLRVEFKRRSGNRRLYENHFRCPVTFGARHNRLVFRTEARIVWVSSGATVRSSEEAVIRYLIAAVSAHP